MSNTLIFKSSHQTLLKTKVHNFILTCRNLIHFTSSSPCAFLWLLVNIALHSSFGFFFSVLAPKVLVGLLAICLANCPTSISRLLMEGFLLLWLDMDIYMN